MLKESPGAILLNIIFCHFDAPWVSMCLEIPGPLPRLGRCLESNLDSNRKKVVLGRKHQGHPKCEETWHSNRRMDTMGCFIVEWSKSRERSWDLSWQDSRYLSFVRWCRGRSLWSSNLKTSISPGGNKKDPNSWARSECVALCSSHMFRIGQFLNESHAWYRLYTSCPFLNDIFICVNWGPMTIELQNLEKAPTDLPSLQLQQMMMMMRPEKNLKVLHAVYQDYTP